MFLKHLSRRNQLSALATGLAAIVIAAIPVTVSFAQSNYNYNGYPNMQQYGYQPQHRHSE